MQASTTQSSATWGLDRIDQRALPLNTTYSYAQQAPASPRTSSTRHPLHAQRVRRARVVRLRRRSTGPRHDCNGHGTHVAGTVGGSTYGVAKGVNLVAVRVLDCAAAAPWPASIAGVDWVTGTPRTRRAGGREHEPRRRRHPRARHRGGELDQRRRHVRGRRRERQRLGIRGQCVQLLAGPGRRCDDDQRDRHDRPEGLVGELRQLRRLVRPGRLDHVGLVDERHRDEHDQRDVDGDSAHGGRSPRCTCRGSPARCRRPVASALLSATTKGIVTSSTNTVNNHLLFVDGGGVVPPPPPRAGLLESALDDDGDGKIDFPADPGCTSTADTSESSIPPPPPPAPACSNGLDDDGDGKIDFPADPGCTSTTDTSEVDPPPPPPQPQPACSNGLDDDGDGKIDFPADPGCTSATDTSEVDPPPPPPPPPPLAAPHHNRGDGLRARHRRRSSLDRDARGGGAVVCVNGGTAAEVPGTWSASLEWLVRRLSDSSPRPRLSSRCGTG